MGITKEEFADLSEHMSLADGTQVLIRPIQPEDSEIEWNFVHNLSTESKYMRFMSAVQDLTPEQVYYFTDIDLSRHMALIAVVIVDGKETEVAVGRYFCYSNRNACEFALAVADEWQGQGIGFRIMDKLIANARQRGLESMEGEIFAINKAMLDLVKNLGFQLSPDPEDHRVAKAVLNLQP